MSEANNNPATNCQQKGRAVAVDMGTTSQPSVGAAQLAGLGSSHGIMGRRFPDGGLLRYRK